MACSDRAMLQSPWTRIRNPRRKSRNSRSSSTESGAVREWERVRAVASARCRASVFVSCPHEMVQCRCIRCCCTCKFLARLDIHTSVHSPQQQQHLRRTCDGGAFPMAAHNVGVLTFLAPARDCALMASSGALALGSPFPPRKRESRAPYGNRGRWVPATPAVILAISLSVCTQNVD